LEIINKEITYKNGTIITITSGNEMSDNIAVVKRSGQSDIVYMGYYKYWLFDNHLVLEYVSDTGVTINSHDLCSDDIHNTHTTESPYPLDIIGRGCVVDGSELIFHIKQNAGIVLNKTLVDINDC